MLEKRLLAKGSNSKIPLIVPPYKSATIQLTRFILSAICPLISNVGFIFVFYLYLSIEIKDASQEENDLLAIIVPCVVVAVVVITGIVLYVCCRYVTICMAAILFIRNRAGLNEDES